MKDTDFSLERVGCWGPALYEAVAMDQSVILYKSFLDPPFVLERLPGMGSAQTIN